MKGCVVLFSCRLCEVQQYLWILSEIYEQIQRFKRGEPGFKQSKTSCFSAVKYSFSCVCQRADHLCAGSVWYSLIIGSYYHKQKVADIFRCPLEAHMLLTNQRQCFVFVCQTQTDILIILLKVSSNSALTGSLPLEQRSTIEEEEGEDDASVRWRRGFVRQRREGKERRCAVSGRLLLSSVSRDFH